jgi:hypothetical protein
LHSFPKSPKTRVRGLALLWLAGIASVQAYGPEGEALLESLRDHIASGRGGEDAYQEALRMLATDPEGGCEEWLEGGEAEADGGTSGGAGGGAADDAAWEESLRAVCPETSGTGPRDGEGSDDRRPHGGPALDLSASQSARPREDGPAPARWSAKGRDAGTALEISGQGGELRRRFARIGVRGFEAQAGHLGRFLEPTRIACVAGNTAYADEGGSSGISGPLASGYPGLDGLAFSGRSGPWRAQAAGAWNRLAGTPLQGNFPDTPRREAGLLAAGLAHTRDEGPDLRAQVLALRLETGGAPATWLGVAGTQAAARSGDWSGRAAGAISAGPAREALSRFGAYAEASISYRNAQDTSLPDWDTAADPVRAQGRLRVRQAFREWADPLQSPRGSLRDTVGGWAMEAPGTGGARAESSFPLARSGGYAAGLRAAAAADWAGAGADAEASEAGLDAGRGEAFLIQGYGPFTWTLGGGLGWRKPGSGVPSAGGWGLAGDWRQGYWRATAALSRRAPDYAGSRPMPLDLSLSRGPQGRSPGAIWSVAWSAADIRRPDRAQRLDLRQSWQGGKGLRIEQKLRLPWTPDGIAGDLAYHISAAAEF